jgi:hypothetical protein
VGSECRDFCLGTCVWRGCRDWGLEGLRWRDGVWRGWKDVGFVLEPSSRASIGIDTRRRIKTEDCLNNSTGVWRKKNMPSTKYHLVVSKRRRRTDITKLATFKVALVMKAKTIK